MTRRLIATAILAATVGAPVLATLPAHASNGNNSQICIGGDNQRRPGYGMGVCIDDPTRG